MEWKSSIQMSSALDIPGVPGEEVSPIEEVEKEEQKWGEE